MPNEIQTMILKLALPDSLTLTVQHEVEFDAYKSKRKDHEEPRKTHKRQAVVGGRPGWVTGSKNLIRLGRIGSMRSFGHRLTWTPSSIAGLLRISKSIAQIAQPLISDAAKVIVDQYVVDKRNQQQFSSLSRTRLEGFEDCIPSVKLHLLPLWIRSGVSSVYINGLAANVEDYRNSVDTSGLAKIQNITLRLGVLIDEYDDEIDELLAQVPGCFGSSLGMIHHNMELVGEGFVLSATEWTTPHEVSVKDIVRRQILKGIGKRDSAVADAVARHYGMQTIE